MQLYLLEMLVLKIVTDNVSRSMRIISCEHPRKLFLQLFLIQFYLILRIHNTRVIQIYTDCILVYLGSDELLGPSPVTISIIIVLTITEAIIIL